MEYQTWTVPSPEMKLDKDYTVVPNYFWCPKAFLLPPNAYKILQYFVRNTYGYHKNRYSVGIRQISDDCNLSPRAVTDNLKILIDGNWLKITRGSDQTSGITREYQLTFGYITTSL